MESPHWPWQLILLLKLSSLAPKLQQEVVKRSCIQQALGLESNKLTRKCAAHRMYIKLDAAACINHEDFLLLSFRANAIY